MLRLLCMTWKCDDNLVCSIMAMCDSIQSSASQLVFFFLIIFVFINKQITWDMVCRHCNEDYCLWTRYEECIVQEVETNSSDSTLREYAINLSHRMQRKRCYKIFVAMHHGYLGKGQRRKIPKCVMNGIRNRYLDSDDNYMGYKSSWINIWLEWYYCLG